MRRDEFLTLLQAQSDKYATANQLDEGIEKLLESIEDSSTRSKLKQNLNEAINELIAVASAKGVIASINREPNKPYLDARIAETIDSIKKILSKNTSGNAKQQKIDQIAALLNQLQEKKAQEQTLAMRNIPTIDDLYTKLTSALQRNVNLNTAIANLIAENETRYSDALKALQDDKECNQALEKLRNYARMHRIELTPTTQARGITDSISDLDILYALDHSAQIESPLITSIEHDRDEQINQTRKKITDMLTKLGNEESKQTNGQRTIECASELLGYLLQQRAKILYGKSFHDYERNGRLN